MIIFKHPKTRFGYIVAVVCILAIVHIYWFRINIHPYIIVGLMVAFLFSITYQVRAVCVYKDDNHYVFKSRRFRGVSVISINVEEVCDFKVDQGDESGGTVAILKNGKVIDLNINKTIGSEMIKVLKAP
jgi:hypothetical protein